MKNISTTPKIIIKTTGIPSAIHRWSLEIGLDEHTVDQLGHDWHLLCDAWVIAELALSRLGGPVASLALDFKPP